MFIQRRRISLILRVITFNPQIVGQDVEELAHAHVPELRVGAERDPAQPRHGVQFGQPVPKSVDPVLTVAVYLLVL